MALIRGAFGGGQIKGSIAGVTFQQGPYGTVIRNRTVPVNPNSTFQVLIRSAFDNISNRWVTFLTNAQRDAWNAYAAQTPLPDRFGTPVATRGRQMYIRSNVARWALGITIIDTAPGTPGVAPQTIPNVDLDTVTGAQILSVSAPPLNAGDILVVRMGQAVNQSKNYYKAPFSFVQMITSATVFPLAFTPLQTLVVNQKYFFASRVFAVDGKVSFEAIDQVTVT